MMTRLDYIESLIEQTAMTESLPSEVRARIVKNQRKNLVAILKKLGRYNPLIGFVLLSYFLLRKVGITATLTQALVASALVVTVSAGGLAVATVVAVKAVITDTPKQEEPLDTLLPQTAPDSTLHPLAPAPAAEEPIVPKIAKYQIIVEKIEGEGAPSVAALMTDTLTRMRKPADQTSPLRLVGTVKQNGEMQTLTIRAYDPETGRIVFAQSADAKKGEMKAAIKILAKELSDAIE